MSPTATLLLTLILLHVVEGLYWIRREAVTFTRGLRGFRVNRRARGPFGNQTHTLYLLPPLPASFECFVVEPWPITFGEDTVWTTSVESEQAGEAGELEPERLKRARADGKHVYAGGAEIAQVSSAPLARTLAKLAREWADAPAAKRKHVLREALERSHDRAAIRARIEQFERATRRLRIYADVFPAVLIGSAYAFFYVPALSVRWPFLLAACTLLLVLTWVETFFAHRVLYPGQRGDRALKLAMLILSFPAAAHARAWLARDLLADFHPLAVAAELLPKPAFRAYAAEVWRALAHPLARGDEAEQAAAETMRDALKRRHEVVLKAEGLDPAELERAPERSDPARAYCPRCHAQYVEEDGPCPDCPGVPRRRFVETAAARS